jgi:hypothetical protein
MAKSYKYKRSRKPLSLEDAKLRMTDSIKAIEKIILTSKDDNKQIQAAHALSGLVKAYKSLIETTEILKRIEELEERI